MFRLFRNALGGLPEGGLPLFAAGAGVVSWGLTTGGGGGAGGGGGGVIWEITPGTGNEGLGDRSIRGPGCLLGAVKCESALPDSFGTGNACFNNVFFPVVFVT